MVTEAGASIDDGSADVPAVEGEVAALGHRRRRIPAAPQFTPPQINDDLGRLLSVVADNEGDRSSLVEALRQKYHASKSPRAKTDATRLKGQQKLAGNVLSSMSIENYGLLDTEAYVLTDLGRELLALPTEALRLQRFAQHILKNLCGMDLLLAVDRIQRRGDQVEQEPLAEELRAAGIELATEATHHGALAQWLRAAGVLKSGSRGYQIDHAVVVNLAGISLRTVDEWSGLTPAQQKFLRTLRLHAETAGPAPEWAKVLMSLAESEHGKVFPTRQKASKVYDPLAADGWIEVTEAEGRGKSGKIAPTPKLLDADLDALTGFLVGDIPADLRGKLSTPTAEIYRDLDAEATYVKGLALELLAMRIASDVGLTPIRFRLRGVVNGGECDLLAEASQLHFTRWLFQCKNTPRGVVGIEQLAREVGMATLLRAHVIVIVTTGTFTRPALDYAHELTLNTPLQVILVGKDVLSRYRTSGRVAMTEYFWRTAREALRTKRTQVDVVLERIGPNA